MTLSCSVMSNLMSSRYGLPCESCFRLYQVPLWCVTASTLALESPGGLYTRNGCPLLLCGFEVAIRMTRVFFDTADPGASIAALSGSMYTRLLLVGLAMVSVWALSSQVLTMVEREVESYVTARCNVQTQSDLTC